MPRRVAATASWAASSTVRRPLGAVGEGTAATPDMLDTQLDKARYGAGETMTIRLGPKFAGTATVLSSPAAGVHGVGQHQDGAEQRERGVAPGVEEHHHGGTEGRQGEAHAQHRHPTVAVEQAGQVLGAAQFAAVLSEDHHGRPGHPMGGQRR